jgi:hypothetical protein
MCWKQGYTPNFRLFLTTGTCSGHVLRTCVCFSDILDITDLLRTFAFQTPVLSDWLCSLRVA